MAYPSDIDDFTDPVAGDETTSVTVPHATQHAQLNTAVNEIETSVGIPGSAEPLSLDYLLKNVASVDPGHTHSIYAFLAGDTFTGPVKIDDDSASAFFVEQNGVNDNTFIVDTNTHGGRVGINCVPAESLDLRYGNMRFTQILNPASAITAAIEAGAGVTAGTHKYCIRYVTTKGTVTSSGGQYSNQVTTAGGDLQVDLTDIPVSGESEVASKKLYRTKIDSTNWYYLLDTLSAAQTTYTDNTADSALGAEKFWTNTESNDTAGKIYINSDVALFVETTSSAMGIDALGSITNGYQNAAFGSKALEDATTVGQSCAFGCYALRNVTTGSSNIAIGFSAGYYLVDGTSNILIGRNAGDYLVSSDSNVALGTFALDGASADPTWGATTSIGNYTGRQVTTGSWCTFLGYYAGGSGGTVGTIHRSMALGAYAQVAASNTCVIGGCDSSLEPDDTGCSFFRFNSKQNTDLEFRFITSNNQGVFTWMDDEDLFDFEDLIKISGGIQSSDGSAGVTGSFEDNSGNTVTVKNGLITDFGV